MIGEAYRIARVGIAGRCRGASPRGDRARRRGRGGVSDATGGCRGLRDRHDGRVRVRQHDADPRALDVSHDHVRRRRVRHARAALRGLPRGDRAAVPVCGPTPPSSTRSTWRGPVSARAIERLTVGTEGRVAADAVRQVLEGSDTGADLPYVPIHSVGMIEFEPPIFLSSSEVTIADGMALSIDAALFHGPWGGLAARGRILDRRRARASHGSTTTRSSYR